MKNLGSKILLLLLVAFLLAGCLWNHTSNQGFCGLYMGDGTYDNDIDKIIYPGEEIPYDLETHHKIMYLPCNDRNYWIDAEGHGDIENPIDAKTLTGTDVLVQLTAYWTLNQDFDALAGFYAYQIKFKAASDRDISGDENSSTTGWNDMLEETMLPALQRAVSDGMFLVEDSIWANNDPIQKQILTDYVMAVLKDKLRVIYGSGNLDYFCGSASSSWPDPSKPGVGEYYCAPINIEIDEVKRNPDQTNSSTEGSITQSERRLLIAESLYGPEAAQCWLGLQDLVQACPTCNFFIDGNPCTGEGTGDQPFIVLPPDTEEVVPPPEPTTVP